MESKIEEVIEPESKPQITVRPEDLPEIKVDFSKSPDSILPARAEAVATEPTQNIEREVKAESNLTDLEPEKLDTTKQNYSPIQNFKNWIQYPASTDKIRILNSVKAPAVVTMASGLIGIATSGAFLMSDMVVTNPVLAGVVGTTFLGSAALTGVGLAVERISDFVVKKIVEKESENRVSFSKLVTVSKAYLTKFSPLYQAMKNDEQFKKSRLIGELHFVGKGKEDWVGIDSKTDRIKDILTGLKNLAESCETNNPSIKNIDNFATMSPILYPQYFSQFGFEIQESSKLKGGSNKANQLINKVLGLFRGPKQEKYPGQFSDKKGAMYTGTITRQALIENKALIAEKLESISRRV